MENISNERIMKAAVKYLEVTGREVIDVFDDNFIAYIDEDEVAIGKVFATTESICDMIYDNRMSRDDFEHVAEQVIYNYPDEVVDIALRADLIEIYVIMDDRAIVKHHINSGVKDF